MSSKPESKPIVICLPAVKYFQKGLEQWNERESNPLIIETLVSKTFGNGEIVCTIPTNVRQKQVFLVGSGTSVGDKSVNDLLFELFAAVDALKRASVGSISVVFPMFPYARQDKKDKSRRPITASMLVNILQGMGVVQIITMDLHSAQAQGFGKSFPFENLYAKMFLVEGCCNYITNWQGNTRIKDVVIMSPDEGGVKRAMEFCDAIKKRLDSKIYNVKFAIMHKNRNVDNGNVDCVGIVGDAQGDIIFIVDDMADTCGTLVKLIEELRARNLSDNGIILPVVSHAIFSPPANERLVKCGHIFTTNTCLQNQRASIDVTPLFGEAIRRTFAGESLSELFTNDEFVESLMPSRWK